MYIKALKPSIDILISLIIIILTFPLEIIIIVILLLSNKGKILFIQNRVGKDGQIFPLYKFKTMRDNKDFEGNYLSDEIRLTIIGRILRKMSLDELPQLLNILKGDMSIIGPRPLLPEYLPFYNKEQYARHNVKPGITGWAQINGRQNIPFSKRIEYDLYYVENISFVLDMKIMLLTIPNVLFGKDIINGQLVKDVDDIGLSKKLKKRN